MELIKISEKVLINPARISSVEVKANRIIVRVENKDHTVTDPATFFAELVDHGINFNDQFFKV